MMTKSVHLMSTGLILRQDLLGNKGRESMLFFPMNRRQFSESLVTV